MKRLRLLCAVTVVSVATGLTGTTAAAQEQARRTVLTIHSGTEDFFTNPVLDAGMREGLALRPDVPIEYFAEYLETEVFGATTASEAMRDYISRKYRGRRIDLVIAMTNQSLDFVLGHRAELFPDAPVVTAGLTAPDEAIRLSGAGIAALTVVVAHEETLKLALELHPSTERVFVIANSSNQQNVSSIRTALGPFSDRVSLVYLNEPTLDGLVKAVKSIPPRSLLFFIWHSSTAAGNPLYSDEVAALVAKASPVPVYGTNEVYLGLGMVGGVIRGTHETGVRLGTMARQVLNGRRPQDIPVENARLVPTFDWRQVQRWGIDQSRIPAGSNVLFRTPTAWDLYSSYIVTATVVFAGLLMLIAGLLWQRTKRRRAEQIVLNREASLRTSFERIRQLAGRLIKAQEAARADIARDLHDDVCQDLVGVSMSISNLKRTSGEIQDPVSQQALSHLQRCALDVIEAVRRLSHDLHPSTLRLLGLAAAMKAYCVEVEKRHDVQVSFESDVDLGEIHPEVAVCLFRIAQEALRNGAVHGNARRLGVAMTRSGDELELKVTDDGLGFDVDAVRGDDGGLGLISMGERAHEVGGSVRITSRLRHGTTIRVHVPAAGRAQEDARDDVPTVPVRRIVPPPHAQVSSYPSTESL
jgi:signal transduction histidine kinase